jgi:hypothetical protein
MLAAMGRDSHLEDQNSTTTRLRKNKARGYFYEVNFNSGFMAMTF